MTLSGCQSLGMLAMHSANVIASAGPFESHRDLSYGPLERQRLDVYVPTRSTGKAQSSPRPVVIFFHGGDWSDGYPDKDMYRFVGDALTWHGFIAVVPNYRRYPQTKFPGFVEDGAYAVAWAHEHIASFGGDPDALFVMGHSAGAHIAAMVAVDEQYLLAAGGDPRWVRGMIGMAGPYSFLPMPDDPRLADLFGPPARYPLSQPVNFVDAHDPPMLLISGGKDHRVPKVVAERMARSVRESGGDVETITYDDLDHIMLIASLAVPVRMLHPVAHDVAAWIEERGERSRSPLAAAETVREAQPVASTAGAGDRTP